MKVLGDIFSFDENTVFRSINKGEMTFKEVYSEILSFISLDTNCSYRISIGTDSQTSSKTVLVSCILVHRIGRGAIGFLHKSQIPRPVKSLREKIYLETCASLQIAYLFDDEKIKNIIANNVEKFDYLNAFHDGKEENVIIISQIRKILGTYDQNHTLHLNGKEKSNIFDIFHVAENYFAIKILNWNAQPYNISQV